MKDRTNWPSLESFVYMEKFAFVPVPVLELLQLATVLATANPGAIYELPRPPFPPSFEPDDPGLEADPPPP